MMRTERLSVRPEVAGCEAAGELLAFGQQTLNMDTVSKEQRSRNMAKVRSQNTVPELKIRSMLHRLGYRYRLHAKGLPGTPDLVFPGRKSVIFIDGCFWHGHNCKRAALPSSNRAFWKEKIGKNKTRDRHTRAELLRGGWRVLVVYQCETKKEEVLRERLVDFLETGQQ
jgi:DNA mismatch endonuclease (patch repair protein)